MSSVEHQGGHSNGTPGEPSAQRQTARRGRRRSDRAFPSNLPAAVNGLVGRNEDIGQVAELLDGSRLVTLTGPPGIGKTRLSLEVARKLAARYPDGASLVELASVTEGASIPRALASALSVDEVPGQSLTETVVACLDERRVLLVLDNCEHLVAACAQVADALLRRCPYLTILATSREPLTTAAETIWQVPPLLAPASAEATQPEVAMGYPAVELFIERARAVQVGFVLDSELAPAVTEICRRLDGIPLAIELAAARLETLTPSEIARRLDDRFSLLTSGSRSVLPRHQTLLAAMDWSHDLLSGPERALFRRLSVFIGGFELEAVEAVCAGGDEPEGGQILDLLARLVAKSLVVADTRNSRARYRLLETIRAYARDRLEEAGESAELLRAHAGFYVALAEQAEPELTGPHQQRWFDCLEAEHDNLRSALEWSLANGETELALRLGGALVIFWRVHCHFSEGRERLDAIISVCDGADVELRAKALWGAGFMTLMAGDIDGAMPILEESRSYFRALDDSRGCARVLLLLGNCAQLRNDPKALSLLEESADLAREADDPWCLSHALGVAGLEHAHHELPAARALLEECLLVARVAQDQQGLRLGLFGLGSVVLRQGDYRSAETLLEEALAVTRALGEDYSTATALHYLGDLALRRGEYDRARQLLEEALGLVPEAGRPPVVPDSLVLLAKASHAEGDRDGARLLFQEVHALAGGTSLAALRGLGALAAEDGDLDEGRRLLERARDLAQASGPKRELADALHGLGELARAAGDTERSRELHHEAIQLRREIGDAPGVVASLEEVAGLAAAAGRHHHAIRLFGAAQALRDRNDYARSPLESHRYEADVALIREMLAAEALQDAWAQGQGLSIEAAVIQASKGRGHHTRPASGWASLTGVQQQVAALVAEGLTNPEVAERLFISLGAVKAHLSRIYSRLGVAGRRDLTREVRRRERTPVTEISRSFDGPRGGR